MTRGEGLAGGLAASGPARRHRADYSALGIDDVQCWEQARQIQGQYRRWLVMWSRWHRTFTAFSCFSPRPLVVDEPTADRLRERISSIELYYDTARPGR